IIIRITALLISLALFLVGCADAHKINYDEMEPDHLGGMYFGMTHTGFSIDFPEGERIPVDQPFLINAKITFYDDVELSDIRIGANSEKLCFVCKELGVKSEGQTLHIEIDELNSDSYGVKNYEKKSNGLPVLIYCERSIVISVKCLTSEKYAGGMSFTIGGRTTYIDENDKLVSEYGDDGDYLYFATDGEYIAFSTISRGTAESYLVYGGDGK
ncbi:MAG: hypothetical protein II329_04640, partial [Clostridia bacterium]|nr:hypothetical protein [Clostridia bacterium]